MMWTFIARAAIEAWPINSLPDLFLGQTSSLPALKRSRSRMEKSLSHNLANPSSATRGVATPDVGVDIEASAMGPSSRAVIKCWLASPMVTCEKMLGNLRAWFYISIDAVMCLPQHAWRSFCYSIPWREKIAHEAKDVSTTHCGSLPTWGSIMRWYCWNMSAVLELAQAAEDSAKGTWRRNQLWNLVLDAGPFGKTCQHLCEA